RDLVEIWELAPVLVLPPPVGVLLERVMVTLHRLGEDERPGARLERLQREVGADRGLHGLLDHHSGAVDERSEKRCEGALQMELHGLRVDYRDAIDGCEVASQAQSLSGRV